MDFTREEYLERMNRTRKSMSEKGLDYLWISDPANICYLTGHNAWSFYVHQGILVDVQDEMPTFIGRWCDAFIGIKKQTWLDEAHIDTYPDYYVQNPPLHPMEVIGDIMYKKGCNGKTIGVEADNYWFSAAAADVLKAKLPDAKFVDSTYLVNWVRNIKSPQEIAYQRRAGKLADLAIGAAVQTIGPGVRECDVVAAIYNAQIRGTEEFGGDYTAIVPMLPAGENAGIPHLTWTDNKFPDSQTVAFELCGCHKRYHAPLARTVCYGKVPDRVREVGKIAVEGLNLVLDNIKPGAVCEDLFDVFMKHLNKYGMSREGRIAYSCGLNYPPDWGEHTASFRPGDKTVLKPNMTMHCIPGFYEKAFGLSISESFVVTETGCETFASYPRELIIL